jgi:hypothetical protein
MITLAKNEDFEYNSNFFGPDLGSIFSLSVFIEDVFQ